MSQNPLTIQKDCAVGISYVLTNTEGEELDRADKSSPLHYLHGVGQIIPGLEKALEDLKLGDKKTVTIAPKEGYGEINPSLRMTFSKDNFPKETEVKPGMKFFAESEGQRIMLTVMVVRDTEVDVDGNHPLSGQTLKFEVEVTHLREATKEELAHGHIHGPGGHHH